MNFNQIQQMVYFQGLNDPLVNLSGYLCDRCKVQPLTESEFTNNYMMNGCRYCNECRCYMKLQKVICIYCNNSWSKRSERLLPMNCECGGLTVCLT